jgi:hypothetical protein
MYSVEYSTAPAVPTLRGRFGTESHDGSGTAGVLVSCADVNRAQPQRTMFLTSKNAVSKIGGTQMMCTATLTWTDHCVSGT